MSPVARSVADLCSAGLPEDRANLAQHEPGVAPAAENAGKGDFARLSAGAESKTAAR